MAPLIASGSKEKGRARALPFFIGWLFVVRDFRLAWVWTGFEKRSQRLMIKAGMSIKAPRAFVLSNSRSAPPIKAKARPITGAVIPCPMSWARWMPIMASGQSKASDSRMISRFSVTWATDIKTFRMKPAAK